MGEARISGSLFHGYTPHERFYQLDLGGAGTLKFNYLFKDNVENLALDAAKFQWTSGYKFFEPIFTAEEGVINGKLEGNWVGIWNQGTWL